MNKVYRYLLLIVMGTPLLYSCGEDRTNELHKIQADQRAIYKLMVDNYYWYKDIPEQEGDDFFKDPVTLFEELLSKKDGNRDIGGKYPFSYIEKINTTTTSTTRAIADSENSYGFEFSGIANTSNCVILYTLPNTPAERAGLQRGDIITHINGHTLDKNKVLTPNIEGSLYSGPSVTIRYMRDSKPIETQLGASTIVKDNPLLICKKLDGLDDTGYVVYNHFTYGTPSEEENNKIMFYDGSYLKDLVEQLKTLNGITDLILDFRYNLGGELNTACTLISLICPQANLDVKLGYLEFNDKLKNKNQELNTANEYLKLTQGLNLNIRNLYVITSNYTASASEFVINALKPFMNVHIIGQKTIGKNVGSQGYTIGNWHVQPIMIKIFNSLKQSEYRYGFEPGIYYANSNQSNTAYQVIETIPLSPLGDPTDPLLGKVLAIKYGVQATNKLNTRAGYNIKGDMIDSKKSSLLKRHSSNLIITPTID